MPEFVSQIVQRYPALSHARYRRFWFASFASVGATQLIGLGSAWLMFELTKSAFQLGVLGAAAALPNIVVTLFGGVIADRFDMRQILRITSSLIACLLLLLTYLDFSGQVEAWQVLSIAAAFSAITGFDWPARVAIYPHLVDRHAFMSAVALNSFIWQSTRMAMPALGGVLIYWAGTWLIFALSAAGFLIMFFVISGLHINITRLKHESPLKELVRGLSFIWQSNLFRWLIGLTFAGMFLSQSYIQIMPVFVDLMGRSEQSYGYLLSAGGIGSIMGTLFVGMFDEHKPVGHFMFGGACLSVLALVGFVAASAANLFMLALLAVFFTAAFSSAYLVLSVTILQIRVPDELRGRVMGIHSMGYSLVPLGGLLLGFLAERIGAGTAVLYTSSVYFLIMLITWIYKKQLRNLRTQELN